MHRFIYKVRNIINDMFYSSTPCFIHFYEFITQVFRIVDVIQSINKPPVRFIIGIFRSKFPLLTHEPQIIVKCFPCLFLPLFIGSAGFYALAVFRYFRSCGSFPDNDMQTEILIQFFHCVYRLFQIEHSLRETDDIRRRTAPETIKIFRIDFGGRSFLSMERTKAHTCPVYVKSVTLRHCTHIYRFPDLFKYRHFPESPAYRNYPMLQRCKVYKNPQSCNL